MRIGTHLRQTNAAFDFGYHYRLRIDSKLHAFACEIRADVYVKNVFARFTFCKAFRAVVEYAFDDRLYSLFGRFDLIGRESKRERF